MAKTRRAYTGASVSSTTSSAIAASGTTSFTVSAATNWPYGSDPFYVVLSPGTASEEKVLVTRTNTGDTTINIASDAVRGLDGTSAVSHDSGATVYPVFTAVDADEANELAAMWESKGDIVSHGASTFARLAVGADDTVLIADSSAGSGLAWGQVDTANIAADAVTNAKIATGAVDTAELAAGAVVESSLAAAVVSKLLPAGTIAATIKSSADTGWLLLDGSTVTGAQSTYPALWAVAPAAWKSGSNLVLPTMANKYLSGKDSGETLGAEGGSNTKSLSATNLPKHTHTLSAHTHTMNDHVHSLSDHTHSLSSHTHDTNPASKTSGGPSVDVVHRKGDGYITSTGPGTSYRIPDMHYDAVTFGMQVYTNTFSHTHNTDVDSTTSGGPSNDTSGSPSQTNTGSNNDATDGPSSDATGDGGAALTGAAFNVESLHMIVNFQIKAH
jgi:microcystin-dependent protein